MKKFGRLSWRKAERGKRGEIRQGKVRRADETGRRRIKLGRNERAPHERDKISRGIADFSKEMKFRAGFRHGDFGKIVKFRVEFRRDFASRRNLV